MLIERIMGRYGKELCMAAKRRKSRARGVSTRKRGGELQQDRRRGCHLLKNGSLLFQKKGV